MPMYHRLINEDDDFGSNNDLNNQTFEFKNRSEKRKNNGKLCSIFETDPNRYDLVEHVIIPNETLQGIALRYNCSISQLRLINHIMSDQDFYMLKVLRIPVSKHSCLRDQINRNNHQIITTRYVNDLIDVSNETKISSKTQVIQIGISKYLTEYNKESKDYQQFLNNLSSDLEEIRKFNESKMEENSPMVAVNNNEINNTKAFINCDGSDYGIHWKCLIFFTVFLCLLVPLYVLYNLERNSTHGHSR